MYKGLFLGLTMAGSLCWGLPATAQESLWSDNGLVVTQQPVQDLAPTAPATHAQLVSHRTTMLAAEPAPVYQPSCDCAAPVDAYCDSCCDPCVRHWWIAGVEMTILDSEINGTHPAVEIQDNTIPAFSQYSTALADVADELTFAPRVWMGVADCNWGIVGRFWYLSESDLAYDPITGGFDRQGYLATSRLKAYNVDLEVIRFLYAWGWRWDLGFGVRYASLEHDAFVAAESINGFDFTRSAAFTSRQFDGTGITLAVGGKRAIHCSKLSLFWNIRNSVIWGDARAEADVVSVAVGANSSGVGVANATAITDKGNAWIGEVQLGVQYEHELKCIPAVAFIKVAAEYQHWDVDADLRAAAISAAAVPNIQSTALADASTLRMDLIGLTIGAGLTW
jgi:hypothetical protein